MTQKIDHKMLAELYGSPEVAATILADIDEGPPVLVERLVTENGRTVVKTDVVPRREALERGVTTLPTKRNAVDFHISKTRSEHPTKEEHEAHQALLAEVR